MKKKKKKETWVKSEVQIGATHVNSGVRKSKSDYIGPVHLSIILNLEYFMK